MEFPFARRKDKYLPVPQGASRILLFCGIRSRNSCMNCWCAMLLYTPPFSSYSGASRSYCSSQSRCISFTWLKEMQRDCEEQYDREAPLYDEKGGVYSNIAHQQFIQEFLDLIPQNSRILDAPCGTGRYLSFLLAKGNSIVGIDQSQGMLERAKAKFPTVQIEKSGLQEIAYREVFDGEIGRASC